jgi:hypothetical protein
VGRLGWDLECLSSFDQARRLPLNRKLKTAIFHDIARLDTRMRVARDCDALLYNHVHDDGRVKHPSLRITQGRKLHTTLHMREVRTGSKATFEEGPVLAADVPPPGFRVGKKVPSSPENSMPRLRATYCLFAIWLAGELNLNQIFKPFVFLVAAIYFLVDAAFLTVARPVARRLADLWIFDSLRAWIVSLRPYTTLALFMVPVIILEPVKPAAVYLTTTGHIMGGLTVLLVGEILKLVLIERLFSISRDKLMSIAAFAWCHDKLCQAREWGESLEGWQITRRLCLNAKQVVRSYVLELKTTSRKQQRLSWQWR